MHRCGATRRRLLLGASADDKVIPSDYPARAHFLDQARFHYYPEPAQMQSVTGL